MVYRQNKEISELFIFLNLRNLYDYYLYKYKENAYLLRHYNYLQLVRNYLLNYSNLYTIFQSQREHQTNRVM